MPQVRMHSRRSPTRCLLAAAGLAGLAAMFGTVSLGAIALVGAGKPTPAQQLVERARGDSVKMEKAYRSIAKMISDDPSDAALKVSAAEAAVSLMRIKTHANSLVVRLGRGGAREVQKQDSKENTNLWSEWAPIAQSHLDEARSGYGDEQFTRNPSSFILSVEAVMYATASRGIISAVASGKAIGFLNAVSKLEELHPDFDGYIYCIYWGAYYLAAPWPVYSLDKARSYFELAVTAVPASKRNQYWAGVGAFMQGDYPVAKAYFERALKEECASSSEQDVCKFLDTESQRALELIATVDA